MDELIAASELSHLIGLIYDCALDPACWPLAMDAMRRSMDFEVSTLNLQRLPSFEVILNVTANVATEYLPMIDAAGADVVEQWGGEERIMSLALDRPHVLSRVNPAFDPATTTNHYYHAFARPQGLVDVLALPLARDAHGYGSLAFGRHESAPPIGDREMAIMTLLLPHVQRAATINRLIDQAESARRSLALVIDLLTLPAMLVSKTCELIHANSAAARLCEAGDLIRRRGSRLEAVGSDANRTLEAALASVGSNEARRERSAVDIPIWGRDGAAGAIQVLPLLLRSDRDHAEAAAAVFVADVRTPFVPPIELAAALYDLTAAEARIFRRLALGETVAEAAAGLGVGASTIKTHMLRIYEKTGLKRRSQLVRLASTLATPLRVSEAWRPGMGVGGG
ncbi:helix-turn-helix transcriptional regulator [Sphingomonas yunnanensis]|uniref:helix-turn-helix transcriptional regulator n=1 Tax=Sphingomonas yunnanensis TaxID=310400 RepID=UPI001CA76322|nr:helix-turn-helix transcriptional regulator [Sphingomonas yunnanensis]MBY9064364.1 helix-turn-helix transcriptional regulator [Sphingomonas yunnanensis]